MKLPKVSVTVKYLLIALCVSLVFLWFMNAFSVDVSETFVDIKGDSVMVYYYAPWCPHCQKFMPTWESFVKQQKANGNSKLSFKKVNMDLKENKSLRSKYDIVSYPTILLHLSNGNVKKFENERTQKNLGQFMRLYVK